VAKFTETSLYNNNLQKQILVKENFFFSFCSLHNHYALIFLFVTFFLSLFPVLGGGIIIIYIYFKKQKGQL